MATVGKRRLRSKQEPIDWDEIGPIFARNTDGQPVCGSRRPGKDEVCMSPVRMAPSGRCRKHGALAGRPVQKGLWADSLPSYLKQDFEQALQDPDIGNMRDSIALMDAFIAQYLKGLLKMPPVETLQSVITDLETEFPDLLEECEEYPIGMETLIKSCVQRLQSITSSRAQEQETRRAIRERAELVKVEAMRIDKASRYVTVEQAMALIAALVTIVNKYVSQESERVLIAGAIDRLISKESDEGDRPSASGAASLPVIPTTSSSEAASS